MSGFGFSTFQVYLLNLPIGVIHGIFSVGATFLCSRFNGVRTLVAPALSIIRFVPMKSSFPLCRSG